MNLRISSLVSSLIVSLTVSSHVMAQENFAGKWEFGGYVSHNTIDEGVASENFIEDNAFSLGGFAAYDHGPWLTTLGLEVLSYRDNAGFSEETEDFFGDVEETDSSANGVLFSAATGPAWHFNEPRIMLYVQGGVAAMLSSERSISNCSNCREEDIDVEGGFFAKAGIVKTLTRVSFGFHVVQYFGDEGLEQSAQLSMGTAF